MRWRVKGADQQAGAEQTIEVEADSEDAAVKLAGRQGVFVESVKPLKISPPPTIEYATPAPVTTERAVQTCSSDLQEEFFFQHELAAVSTQRHMLSWAKSHGATQREIDEEVWKRLSRR